ncbi:MAG: hypothetical protein WAZ12_02460 [Candidatus Absconditicoccaceae bacterium]
MGDFDMGGGLGEGLDVGGAPREDANKVSEEDRKRVQEDNQKAKQASQQIKKDKKINNDMANFLGYLLKEINSDKIVSGIYNVFFKVKNPKTDITYLRKNPNNIVIVGIFAPFYKEEIKRLNLITFFEKLYNFGNELNLDLYIKYLKKLSGQYHDNVPIDKEEFLNFLIDVIMEFGLIKTELKEKTPVELKKSIENMLY